jgi:hypothetical protein
VRTSRVDVKEEKEKHMAQPDGPDDTVDMKRRTLRQWDLQDYMLRADSAMARIGKGIHGGLIDEVAAGAEDLEKALRAIEQAKIPADRQADWKKRSAEAADNAKKLRAVAAAAGQKGDREIAAEIVDLYSTAMRTTIACHSTFRQRG